MAFDLSTATPVNASSDKSSSLLPTANDFPDVTKRAKQNKETDVQRLKQLTSPDLTEAAALVPGVASNLGSQAVNLGQGAFNYVKENPLASAAAGGAAVLAGQKVYKTLKDKVFGEAKPTTTTNATPELFSRIEPDLNVSNKPVFNEPILDMAPAPATTQATQTVDPVQAMKNKLLASSPESETDFIQRKFGPRYNPNPTEPAFFPVKPDVPPIGPETPLVTPETPAAPLEPTKPVAPPEAPKQPSGPLMTGTGKPAFAGEAPPSEGKQRFKTEYSDISKVPKGYAFVPGGQAIDTPRNSLGQETYTQEFSKRDFPKDYKEALKTTEEINRALGRPTREEMLAQGIKPPEPTPGITQKISGYKLVKVAGIAGALVAMSDIAKAASKGNYGEAAARSVDLATDFIPVVGTAKTAFSGMGLNADEEQQLKQLQYRAMVGGGQGFRGIAPPTR